MSNRIFSSIFSRRQEQATTSAPGRMYFVHNGHDYKFHPHFPHETYLFRDRMIENLPKYLIEKFPEGVTIISHACSLGHEPYSLAAKFGELIGTGLTKERYPIKAYDIDSDIVQLANQRIIILPEDVQQKSWKTSYPFQRAFQNPTLITNCGEKSTARDFHRANLRVPLYSYNVSNELSELVSFEQANIEEHFKSPSKDFSKPVVLLFRNVWQCLKWQSMQIADNLQSTLKEGSLLVVGDSEVEYEDTNMALISNGFVSLRDEVVNLFGPKKFSMFDFSNYNYLYLRKKL